MKIYISADIEGVAGTTSWSETDLDEVEYSPFQMQMTAEVKAACLGALDAGAAEVWIKDAHGTGRNIIQSKLPEKTVLLRGWSGHPYSMMQELDSSFDACLMVGYHAGAGSDQSPLAHTLTSKAVEIKLNGQAMSEFHLNSYTAALQSVPVVFVSGDRSICDQAARLIPGISACAVKWGRGDSTANIHPELVLERIEEGARAALQRDFRQCRIELPDSFLLEIRYKKPFKAYKASFYPGAEAVGADTVRLRADNYFDVLRMLTFVL